MNIRGLSTEQQQSLYDMLNNSGRGLEPGQVIGQGFDALNIGLQRPAETVQGVAYNQANRLPEMLGGKGKYLTRFAASKPMLNLLKVGTGLGAVGGVLGAGDILLGNDSLANKAMDTAAMGIGGFIGMAGGPVGAAAGAGLGKAASDGLQYLFGDKKTAEQRQMEQALAGLQGGRY